ncbi:ABC transporter permease [Candidatus Berkelbacteria bacterium]|nr:ABC transporter permease [Candidatus Berkelbacteria bacterium]
MNLSNIFSRKNRILLSELVITDFKLRYQGSVLGYLWSLLKPLLLFTILYLVFVKYLRFGADIAHFEIYLLLGVVLWNYFVESTNQGLHAIVNRSDMIRKINFPKYIIVLSTSISALINLLINLVVVILFAVLSGVEFRSSALLLPINIVELYIISLSFAFLLSALMVKFRDINYIWEVIMQALFYLTPIIYPISMVINTSELAAKILLLNPVAMVIQDARYNLISEQTVTTSNFITNPLIVAIPYILIVLLILIASSYFKNNSKHFAENI